MRIEFPVRSGQRALLRVPGSGRLYSVTVEEVGDESLVVYAPMFRNRVVAVRPGTQVELQYLRSNGVYGFSSVVKRVRTGHLSFLELELPDKCWHLQRRDHVRWPARLILKVVNADHTTVSGYTRDLSGGGLGAVLPQGWEPGQVLQLELELPGCVVAAAARVVRSQTTGPSKQPVYHVAMEFVSLEEADRERIIRYVFARQREFLRSGMGNEEGE